MTLGETPADHFTGVVVHDDPDVRPSPADADVAHIPDPNLIWRLRRRMLEQQIRDALEELVAMAVVLEAPSHTRFKAVFPHDPRHPVPAADDAPRLEGSMDARIAVGLAARPEDRNDLRQQALITQLALARFPIAPGVVAAP